MTFKPEVVRDFDAAEDERTASREAVDVVAEAGGGHA
jgi:hypothetical protein